MISAEGAKKSCQLTVLPEINEQIIQPSKKDHNSLQKPFLWGAATSAFQIEGGISNDMTHWEKAGSFRRDGHDPRYGAASDHWNRWSEDLRLLNKLNLNAYRFSLSWSRIEPEPGRFSTSALDQYDRMVDQLCADEITPMLTLHHFTHPVWFHKQTPWHRDSAIESFTRMTKKVVQCLGDRIKLFVTLNEPVVWVLAAYGDARFPPGRRDLGLMMTALAHMLTAHREAYGLIKALNSDAEVGIAKNFIAFHAFQDWLPWNRISVSICDNFYNKELVRAFGSNRLRLHFPFLLRHEKRLNLDNKIDFWGLNYYCRTHISFKPKPRIPLKLSFMNRSGEGVSDLGWESYSEGLWQVLTWLQEAGKPMYITENGLADADDLLRRKYLSSHLGVVARAREKKMPLRGYFHWSLMDNYEWLEGKRARFGLFSVDYDNGLRRSLRPSGRFYADYVKAQRIKEFA